MRSLRTVLVVLATSAVLSAVTGQAVAEPAPPKPSVEQTQHAPQVEHAPNAAAKVRNLQPGESVVVGSVDGRQVTVHKNADGALAASVAGASARGTCTYAVTAGVYALGAGVLATAAASGGIVVAGAFLAPEIRYQLAGVAGSFSALYAIIAAYVC